MHDIKQIINDRIIGQYKDSPVILALMESLSSEFDLAHSEIRRTINERFFDNAEKVNLDIIGQIVGIGRQVTDFVDTDYFSFLQDPTGKGFDSLTEKVKAGRYRSADENTVTTRKLIDSEYRVLINAKILKNISNITPNDVLLITRKILSLMYPLTTINVNIEETGNASFRVKINYILTTAEKSFISSLDLIPRPVGVKIEYVYEDIDIALEVSLNTNVNDSVVSISLSAPSSSLVSVQLEDTILLINSNLESNSSLNIVLSDSAVSISVAPPGAASLDLILENVTTFISTNIEERVNIGVSLENSIVSMSAGVTNDADLIVQNGNSITSIQSELVAEILLARIAPVDFVSSCSIVCTGGDYSVDWGNGYIGYSAGATATSIPSGEIKVKEVGIVSNIKFTSDTYSSIVIEDGSNLTNINSICINLTKLVSFSSGLLPALSGQSFSAFEGCSSLLVAPAIDYSGITALNRTFYNCVSMSSSSNISLNPPAALTRLNSTFFNCNLLTDITVFSTNLVSDWGNSFGGCSALVKIPAFSMTSGTTFSGTYNNCNVLQCIANIDTTGTNSSNLMFVNSALITAPNLTQQAALESSSGSTFSTTCP